MQELLQQALELSSWQICGLAMWLLFQGLVVSLFPEEVIVASLGALWGIGKISFLQASTAIFLSLLPANFLMVCLSRRIGRPLLRRKPFSWFLKESSVNKASEVFAHYGIGAVVLTRFTPFIRGPMYVAAGISNIKLRQFALIDGLAALVQVPSWLFLGRISGAHAMEIFALIKNFAVIALLSGLLLATILCLRQYFLSRNNNAHPNKNHI